MPCQSFADSSQELLQQSDLSESPKQDMPDGIHALQSALRNIELHEAKVNLVARVQDWKGHKVNAFGNLLLFDVLDIIIDNSGTVRTVCPNSYQITTALLAHLCPNAINSFTSISLTGSSYLVRSARRVESLHAIEFLDRRGTPS
jgi:hypothetical protein